MLASYVITPAAALIEQRHGVRLGAAMIEPGYPLQWGFGEDAPAEKESSAPGVISLIASILLVGGLLWAIKTV
jgi:hypothetical protein